MFLSELSPGQKAEITSVGGEGELRQHLLDMGLIPGVVVTVVKYAPMGDPVEISVHGYELTIRLDDAKRIGVETSEKALHSSERRKARHGTEHPGLGEEGRFHPKGSGDPIPDGTKLTFALVGNQNSGKTTLFNQLTGANQHVGNFPGVTVDRKDGVIRKHPDTVVTDLPGIYSMSPYSSEELVSRDFVLNERPLAIINIIDVTSVERSLYLTMQLLEMGIPTVVALNMMDEMTGNGGSVDVNEMERLLGVPVVPIAAAKNEGVDELIGHAVHVAKYRERPLRQDFCDSFDNGGAVHRCLHAVIHLIEDHAEKARIPVRFAAGKLVEGDKTILEKLDLDENEKEMLEHIVIQMEKERGLDRAAAMADMRYSYINKVCDRCVTRPRESREHIRSQTLDRILTGKYTAIPVFILIMAAIFYLTFALIGPFFQGLIESGVDRLGESVGEWMASANVNVAVQSLVTDGIINGVGSVVSFLPLIVIMFLFLSILEDSGYLARIAFVMDKLLRRLGLSGRSIVPLLIGFGCTVPAVMATRTLPSARDRKLTVLLTPFMSCTAKLPIYAFFAAAFFPDDSWWIVTALYLLGIVLGVLCALIFKKTLFRGEAVPFVMELPNYRLPRLKNVVRLLWDKAKDFLQRAFTVILIATVVVWFLQSFDFRLNFVSDTKDSILAAVAGAIAPVMAPVGLGDWRVITSLVSGFMAKEGIVAMMELLFASSGLTASLTSLTAASMLVFSLLYTPCVAAVASIRRELGARWSFGVIVWQCAVAWIAALAVRLIGLAAGLG